MHPVFLRVLVLASVLFPVAAVAAPAPADWTVMVYIAGDNSLEPYVRLDIENELALAGSTAQVQVVALADRIPGLDDSAGDWTSTKLFHITTGMTATASNQVADWGERNMGDPETLVDFVNWTRANHPANHYALFLWGHGWTWRTSFTMGDDTSGDAMDPGELVAALPDIGYLDVVGYDGCQMASIEVQALWSGYAGALVHSQEYVGWDGLEYESILPALHANPSMSPDELASVATQSAAGNHERTFSATAMDARWDDLQDAVDTFALALRSKLSTYRQAYTNAFRASQNFWADPMSKDLYDVAAQIHARVADPIVRAAAVAVMTAIDEAIIDEWHINSYSGAHGITIFVPTKSSQLDYADTPVHDFTYYRTLPFATATRWDEFIAAYVGA